MGIRVYELAKELGLSSKELLLKLKELHVAVKGHMSALDDDTTEIMRHELSAQTSVKKKETHVKIKKEEPKVVTPALKVIKGKIPITVKELSVKLQMSAAEVIKKLMSLKILAALNHNLDEETINKIAPEFGFVFEKELTAEEKLLEKHMFKIESGTVPRPVVVTFMGHVDHGKTSLLDSIRKSNVAQKESGGITQHIGAYEVTLEKGKITFLDTPGHEAFTAMRARGANITDIVIIVVAADDGVMPQTIEAINHAKAAKAPIVVAINKVDLPGADVDKVKRQLSELDLTSEDWGGKTITVEVSAKKGTGIDHLLEMIILEAELLELKASPHALAKGVIIESKISSGSGPTATILVQNGTLRVYDVFVCGNTYGKVRAMTNDRGERILEAGPSVPVEISGLVQVPQVADVFYVVEDEKKARELSNQKVENLREQNLIPLQRMSLDQLYQKAKEGQVKELNLIIKADVQGSLEAVTNSLQELSTKDITVKVIHSQVGNINESDVMLAEASNAVIIGFHVGVDVKAKEEADKTNIDIRLYRIIYDAINDLRLSLEGLLEPTIKETFIGRAKVLQIFKISNVGKIAGCIVVKGKFIRTIDKVKLFRNEECIFEGKLDSLKHYKDDVKEVGEGLECGIGLVNFTNAQTDDIIECYRVEKVARKL